jgi:hypothetical protein
MAGHKVETLTESRHILIGRSNKCDVCIIEEGLSRQHCAIDYVDGSFFITDLGSANGVFINGLRIPPHEKIPFDSFNTLSIAHLDCVVVFSEELNDPKNIAKDMTPWSRSKAQENKKVIKKEISKKYSLSIFPLMLPFSILAVSIFYIYTNKSLPEENVVHVSSFTKPKLTIPIIKKEYPNEFKTIETYRKENALKTCPTEPNICQIMKLDIASEGIYEHEGEVSLYLNPGRNLNEIRYTWIKNLPDALELIVLDKYLSSFIMNRYFLKDTTHLHLILNTEKGSPYKIFRFHPDKFNQGNVDRMSILKLLTPILKGTAKSDTLWDALRKNLQVIDIKK